MKKRKAFTMIEILTITVVVGIWLLSIVFAINKAKITTNHIKQETIATQLAKEWIEMVYHTRNTNLLKHSNNLDKCRLNINPNQECDWNNEWFSTWNYIISWNSFTNIVNEDLILLSWVSDWDKNFALCLTGWQRTNCPWEENNTKYGKFFRVIKWVWLYDKDINTTWWNLLNCNKWNDTNCSNNIAKEYRFCSVVLYLWDKKWKAEICGIMTNFFD